LTFEALCLCTGDAFCIYVGAAYATFCCTVVEICAKRWTIIRKKRETVNTL